MDPFSIGYFSIFQCNPGPFSIVMWLFTGGVTKWLWYICFGGFIDCCCFSTLEFFFFKQAFHCLKQMLLLIVVGNGQGIERPLARRKQVAFSKVDLMCFFYMPTTKPRTAAELTVLHWDLGLLERCPSVPMAGCIRDTWLIGLSRPLTWRWWQSGDGTTVSKWHEKWCQNGFGGIFWGKQIVRYAKKHVKQWINRK